MDKQEEKRGKWRKYDQGGICKYDDKCRYQHKYKIEKTGNSNNKETQEKNYKERKGKWKTRKNRKWGIFDQKGTCKFKGRCWYQHRKENMAAQDREKKKVHT